MVYNKTMRMLLIELKI